MPRFIFSQKELFRLNPRKLRTSRLTFAEDSKRIISGSIPPSHPQSLGWIVGFSDCAVTMLISNEPCLCMSTLNAGL